MKSLRIVIPVVLASCIASACLAAPLTKLYLKPGNISVRPNMQQKFEVVGLDSMDNEVPVTEPLTWSTQPGAGSITQTGQFTAGTTAGFYQRGVTVTTPSGLIGVGMVTVSAPAAVSGYVFERSWGNYIPGNLAQPSAIAQGPNNTILVCDPVTYCIQQYDTEGRFVGMIGPKIPVNSNIFYALAMATYGSNIYVGGYCNVGIINDQGTVTAAWSCPEAGLTYVSGIAVAKDGNIFVCDLFNSKVAKMTPSGSLLLSFCSQGSNDGQLDAPSSICIAPDGCIYVADSHNNRVQKFDQTGKFLRKWTSGPGFEVNNPNMVVSDAAGNIYVTDYQSKLYRINASDSSITKITTSVPYYLALGMTVDAAGNIYILSAYNSLRCVMKFDSKGNLLAKWGKMRPGAFNQPGGVCIGPDDLVYVADTYNHYVQRFDTSGNCTGSWPVGNDKFGGVGYPRYVRLDSEGYVYASTTLGVGKYSSTGTPIKRFDVPSSVPGAGYAYGLAVGPSGYVYQSIGNDSIYRFNASGEMISSWGTRGTEAGQMYGPYGMSTDASGNLYVADSGNKRIQKFDAAGNFLSQWSTGGDVNPVSVCPASDGSFFVACQYPSIVRKYSATGSLLGSWGGLGQDAGQFYAPYDVAIDKSGNFYVADMANNRIVKYARVQQALSKIKDLADGEFVVFSNQTVTATVTDMGDCLFIESPDRSCGIRVTGVTAGRGYNVTVMGAVSTVNGERTINATGITVSSFSPLQPVALTNKALGGADLNFDPATGKGQRGVEDGSGANNIGLLVTTTGRVTGVGKDFFYIDDGTHARDGSIFVGVRVRSRNLTKPKVGDRVTVTGISRINQIGDRYFRSISARLQSDIVVVQ